MTFFIVETEDEPMIYFGGGGPDTVQYIVGANGVLHPSATFTRASAGTTEIAQGVFSQAAVNEPRYQWVGAKRGLLIEPAATNLLFPSSVAQTMSVAVTAQAYTLSFFGAGSVTLSGASTGVVAGTGTTLKEFTFTPTAGTLTLTVPGSVTQWQLETGIKATSRIVTISAAAFRAPDIPSITTSAFGFNSAEGTFVFDIISPPSAPLYNGLFALSGGLSSNRVGMHFTPTPGQVTLRAGDASQINMSFSGTAIKIAFSFGSGMAYASINGGAVSSIASASLATAFSLLNIGAFDGQLNGVIFSLPYYPRKYSAAELQAASA